MPSGIKQAFASKLSDVDTVARDQLGTLRFEGNKIYKYVQYKEGAAATDGVAGEVTYYYAPGGDFATLGYSGNKVTSDLSDSAEVGAGVLQAAMSDNEYGWVQVRGPALLTIALTAGADGDALTPTGSADGTLDVSAAVTDNVCATAEDISAKQIICNFLL
jgi:hypothetical protein